MSDAAPLTDAPVAMLDLAGEVADHEAALLDAVTRVLRSGQFVGGPEVDAFEAAVAERLDVPHAVGVNSGTDALRIALEAAGIGPGDEVVTTPFSFIATAEAIARVGATPRFADVDPDTLNLDPTSVAARLTPRTRALLPVHLFGLPADMAALRDLAVAHDLFVLEDAAQAFGAHYPARCARCDGGPRCSAGSRDALAGRAVGALGHAAAFSFYPTKTLGAYGDAGMITTHDDAVADAARRLRVHGSTPTEKYRHEALGHNSRLDALQAAILRTKLAWVDDDRDARRRVAERYRAAFDGADDVTLPPHRPEHAYHQYTIRVPAGRRDAVAAALAAADLASARFYPIPLPDQPALAPYVVDATPPVAAEAATRVLSLPIHPRLGDDDVDRVARTVRTALRS